MESSSRLVASFYSARCAKSELIATNCQVDAIAIVVLIRFCLFSSNLIGAKASA